MRDVLHCYGYTVFLIESSVAAFCCQSPFYQHFTKWKMRTPKGRKDFFTWEKARPNYSTYKFTRKGLNKL
jgi:hypothetical protein